MDDNSFFSNLANALIDELRNEDEKKTANLWIKKLQEITDDVLRLKYIKILIFSIQKDISSSIFGKSPPNDLNAFMDMLKDFSDPFGSNKNIVDTENKSKMWTSTSGDFREYCSIQQINDKFTHGYYGISSEGPLFKNTFNLSDVKLTLSEDELINDEIDEFIQSNQTVNVTIEKSCKCSDEPHKYTPNKNRPCWGRNRYMERLIDQSPHSIGDLDAIGVNAMLHKFEYEKKIIN